MKSALLVAILAAVLLVVAPAARAADYSFNGNVTVSDPDGTLKFRFTTTVARPQAAAFLSLLAQVNHNDDGTEVKVDTLAGWVAWKRFPAGLLSYFDASLDLQSPGDFQAEACTYSHTPLPSLPASFHAVSPAQDPVATAYYFGSTKVPILPPPHEPIGISI